MIVAQVADVGVGEFSKLEVLFADVSQPSTDDVLSLATERLRATLPAWKIVLIQTSVTAIHARLGTVSCHPITVLEARPMVHWVNVTSELEHMMRRRKRLRNWTTALQPIM
ncbi:unnamed protein product [Echinostoma caproni]|uniref:STAS domain-containing protein n=1 Tax=Echinostoma caproni TaxID=27848 RepID=A0A183AM30_9TREM|nr:unnamed protein product [Echinostoma caproni]